MSQTSSSTARYGTRLYRAAASGRRLLNPGAWPYFIDRVQRRLTGNRLRPPDRPRMRALYGPAACDLDQALTQLGLERPSEDAEALCAPAFAQARERIDALGMPFAELGIAGACDTALLHALARAVAPKRVLETGVALGWSSLVLLLAAREPDQHLVSVDLPYPFLLGDSWVGAAVPPELRPRWTLIKAADRAGLPRALRLNPAYDLIHYDSDKSVEGRRWAYPLLWGALARGGVMASDDVGDNPAWADFCAMIGAPLIVVERPAGLTGVVRKAP